MNQYYFQTFIYYFVNKLLKDKFINDQWKLQRFPITLHSTQSAINSWICSLELFYEIAILTFLICRWMLAFWISLKVNI